MKSDLFLTKQLFYGAAAATLLGLGAGAWLQPPASARPDADPYAHVVFNLPPDDPYSGYALASSGWATPPPAALPATESAWRMDEPFDLDAARRIYQDAAEPARMQMAALTAPEEPAPPEQAPAQTADASARWPSTGGDILDLGEAPAQAAPPLKPSETDPEASA